MAKGDLQRVFEALQQKSCRYLVVGGVAVVLHGHPRFTADLDLVVSLHPKNAAAVIDALTSLDYRPRAPVQAHEFTDPAARQRMRRHRLTLLILNGLPRLMKICLQIIPRPCVFVYRIILSFKAVVEKFSDRAH